MRIINLYKLLQLSAVCLMVAMAAGCTKSDDFEQPQLSVSDKELKFANHAGEATISVATHC